MATSNQQPLTTPRGGASHTCDAETTGEAKRQRDMRFGFVYDSSYNHITFLYLTRAVAEDCRFHLDLNVLKPNFDIEQLLSRTTEEDACPEAILHETGSPGLPRGLNSVSIPTALLDVDTFGWTSLRLKWAMLFDYVFTWHPSYVRLFQEAGHPRVFALPHAVDARFCLGADVDSERLFDIGFVGHSGRPEYAARDRVNACLAKRFKANDFGRSYTKDEVLEIYKESCIVVNVSRGDFPQEANMRCYEAMASGALLLTGMPTELTEWGLREGEHFIGWRSEEEIPDLVDHFLQRREQRRSIAQAGQERTLQEFTYQRCVQTITDALQSGNGQLFAPARQWPAEEIHLLYLSYYHRYRLHSAAFEEFRHLRCANSKTYCKGLPMVLKTLRHAVKWTLF